MATQASPIAPRRRNGRPQACEPCRKRKTACDHSLPICSRCKNRRTDKDCVYLAAPMTRRSVTAGRTTTAPAQELPVSPATTTSSIGEQATSGGQTGYRSQYRAQFPARPNQLFSNTSGFLGPTSFSSTFLDNSEGLESFAVEDDPSSSTTMAKEKLDETQNAQLPAVNDSLVQLGMHVLEHIPDISICQMLHDRYIYPDDGISRLSWRCFAGDLERTVEASRMSKGSDRRAMVHKLISNTARVLHDADDPQEWIASMSGDNLRWEVLGLLFTYWAIGAVSITRDDPIFETQPASRNDPRRLMLHLKECANACATICSALDCTTPQFVLLLYRCNTLESYVGGDASFTVWKKHAELVAVLTFAGLHNDVETKVTLCSEVRRRVYAKVFNIDKVISAFVGRPPLLSRRFSSTPLPLDVDDSVLLAGEPQLSRKIAELDENGWNLDGHFHASTTSRARTAFAFVRDGILELALGTRNEHTITQALDLKQQTYRMYEQLPVAIVFRPSDPLDLSISRQKLFSRFLIRLGYLQNLFILERLLLKDGRTNGQELMDVAKEMLSLTLLIFKHPDRFLGFQSDFEWLVMSFAVPASGTLCVELLRQAKKPLDSQLVLSKSEIVQNLSLLVAFLDWVKPSAPNADLCYRVKDIVSKVLDQILNGTVASSETEQAANGNGNGATSDFNFELPTDFTLFEDFGNPDLMGTFNWLS